MTEREPFHEVGPDDLFFSTTDRRGVIHQANASFIEFSRYSREQLVGAPHSVIRNPRMPGGVFSLMWRALKQGRPFAGYVHNRAADGSRYSVFATVTPLPDGYLSVRIRPQCSDRFEAADQAYRTVSEVEAELARNGANRRDAAAGGAKELEGILADHGYDSYERFQWDVLPGEMARHQHSAIAFPDRPDAVGRLGAALSRMRDLGTELELWLSEQDELAGLTRSVRRSARRLQHELGRAESLASEIERVASEDRDLGARIEPLVVWAQMQGIVRGYIVELIASLTALENHSAETRFRLALAQLHASTLAHFLAELSDGGPAANQSAPAIHSLVTALRLALEEMGNSTATHRQLIAQTAKGIERTRSVIEIPRRLLLDWRDGAGAETLPSHTADLAGRVSGAISSAGNALDDLAHTTERCAAFAAPHDPARLTEILNRIDRTVSRVCPADRAAG